VYYVMLGDESGCVTTRRCINEEELCNFMESVSDDVECVMSLLSDMRNRVHIVKGQARFMKVHRRPAWQLVGE